MNLTNTLLTLAMAAIVAAISQADERQPVRLIFDTDMMGDVDDVGTAAVLHVNDDGSDAWRTTPDKDHAYLVRKMDPKQRSRNNVPIWTRFV